MILGRPTNLWLGFVTAIAGLVTVIGVNVLHSDPVLVATLVGSGVTVLGALIALIANAPPTVADGGNVRVQTVSGIPNATATLTLSGPKEAPTVDATPVASNT